LPKIEMTETTGEVVSVIFISVHTDRRACVKPRELGTLHSTLAYWMS
jgi:hypothetical protein